MADETKPVEDTGPPPWERVWNSAREVVQNFTQPIDNLIEQAKQPWEMSWSGPRKVDRAASVQPNKPEPVQNASERFESVFSKLVNTESRGKHTDASGALVTSPVGAEGITQVMPKTGANPGYGVVPIQNTTEKEYLRFGRDYLNAMLKEFNGNYEHAVAAYNAGPKTVQKAINKSEKQGGDFKLYLPEETRKYVNKILGGSGSTLKKSAERILSVVTGSSDANAAADFSDYLKTNTSEQGDLSNGKGTYVSESNRIGSEAVKLIQSRFPQFASDINTKVTSEKAGNLALAEYGGLSGDTIKAGKLVRSGYQQFDKNGKEIINTSGKEWEQRDVNGYAATLMHELQHARMSGIQSFDYGLGDDWRDMLKDAGKAGFPSVDSAYAGGDKLNEFLATATVIHEMNKAGVKLTDNKFGPLVKELGNLEKKYPWLRQYVVNYIQPEALSFGGAKASAEQRQVPKYQRKK